MPGTERLPRAERRAQLIGVAAGAFLQRGYDNTSMEDVAQAAGVSRLIVYRVFESKADLYRTVLGTVLYDLGQQFVGLDPADVHERGAAHIILPVARAHPDAFRLLWRNALREPEFASVARELRTYVTYYAREILQEFIADEALLDWAARSAGAHLIDGLCNWLDDGDPSRDDEFATMLTNGLRALATAWSVSAPLPTP